MNRRRFLTSSLASGAAPAHGRASASQTPPRFAKRTSAGLERYSGSWTYTQAAHLLRRAMVGPTDAEIRRAVSEGMAATVNRLLAPFTPSLTLISDWAGTDAWIRPANPSDPTQYQAWQIELFRRRDTLSRWWEQTIATGPVSIQERMTLFWHNHFTSELQTVNFAEFMYVQNQLLRSRSLGNFKQFTLEVTRDVAMLLYLDGAKNYKRGNRDNVNENYARELMELFTCGVTDWNGNPNYTQDDVHEAARSLSGWTGTTSAQGTSYAGLASQFIPQNWDSGQKTLMGQTGAWKDSDVIDIIFAQRAEVIAKFICGKLYRNFVYATMDQEVVTEMASTFRTGNWELRPVVEQLLQSAHFYDPTNIGAVEKSPVDYMLGMVRQLGLTNVPDFDTATSGRTTTDLLGRMGAMGMQLFDPPNVKGWEGGRTWVSTSTLPIRQKFGIDVANGALRRQQLKLYVWDPVAFAKRFPDYSRIDTLSDDMARALLNTEPSTMERQTLRDVMAGGTGAAYEWDIDDPTTNAENKLRQWLVALVQLAKFQLD